jgi:large subunit ribosomal protein L10
MITREKKESEVSAIQEKLKKAKAAFVVDFKGMKVEQVTQLRKTLFPLQSEMKVVRNTLARRAMKGFPEIDKAIGTAFRGTNAFIFSYGDDVSASAKALAQYAKDIELFQLKTGVMDGQAMDQAKITFLATLPTKDVLRAQLLGVLNAPGSKLVRTLNEVPASLARVLAARKE